MKRPRVNGSSRVEKKTRSYVQKERGDSGDSKYSKFVRRLETYELEYERKAREAFCLTGETIPGVDFTGVRAAVNRGNFSFAERFFSELRSSWVRDDSLTEYDLD